MGDLYGMLSFREDARSQAGCAGLGPLQPPRPLSFQDCWMRGSGFCPTPPGDLVAVPPECLPLGWHLLLQVFGT